MVGIDRNGDQGGFEGFQLGRRRRGALPPPPTEREPEWLRKTPMLFDSKLHFNNTQHPLEKIGSGKVHKVFKFTSRDDLALGGTRVNTSKVVLKILNLGQVAPKKTGQSSFRSLIEDDNAAYDRLKGSEILKELGGRVAERYADPTTIVDPLNRSNGRFWIFEYIPNEITGEGWQGEATFEGLGVDDQKTLTFAKNVLTHMAKTGDDFINDFARRNTRIDDEGQFVIIDTSPSETDKWDKKWMLNRYVVDWSNENEKIFDYLTADFPEALKVSWDDRWKEEPS